MGTNAQPTWTYGFDQLASKSPCLMQRPRDDDTFDQFGRGDWTSRTEGGRRTTSFTTASAESPIDSIFKKQLQITRYDRLGRVATNFWLAFGASYPSNSTEYYYNALGQLTNITERTGGGSERHLSYAPVKRKWYYAVVPPSVRRAPPLC